MIKPTPQEIVTALANCPDFDVYWFGVIQHVLYAETAEELEATDTVLEYEGLDEDADVTTVRMRDLENATVVGSIITLADGAEIRLIRKVPVDFTDALKVQP